MREGTEGQRQGGRRGERKGDREREEGKVERERQGQGGREGGEGVLAARAPKRSDFMKQPQKEWHASA